MRDPYDVLGVSRSADADAIKQAYRKLAKQYHPDVNPGDKTIENKFKDISAAYDLLSDPAKRRRYDRGEIGPDGTERAGRGGGAHDFKRGGGFGGGGFGGGGFGGAGPGAGGAGGAGAGKSGGFHFDADDIFEMFNQNKRPGAGAGGSKKRGADVSYSLSVDFVAAATGARRRLTLPDGRTLDVVIPPGTGDGAQLRLKGQGQAAPSGGAPGDAFVEVHIDPHPYFERRGQDIHLDLPITLPEAVLGGGVPVPTIDGKVSLKIPPGSSTGATLRLKGKGVPNKTGERGDQYVRLVVALPDVIDAELKSFMERWGPSHAYDVRRKFD